MKKVTELLQRKEFVRKCEEVYMKNRADLESKYGGKIVALYDGGIAAVGTNIDEVSKEAEKKFPDKIFYVRRIGRHPAAGILF